MLKPGMEAEPAAGAGEAGGGAQAMGRDHDHGQQQTMGNDHGQPQTMGNGHGHRHETMGTGEAEGGAGPVAEGGEAGGGAQEAAGAGAAEGGAGPVAEGGEAGGGAQEAAGAGEAAGGAGPGAEGGEAGGGAQEAAGGGEAASQKPDAAGGGEAATQEQEVAGAGDGVKPAGAQAGEEASPKLRKRSAGEVVVMTTTHKPDENFIYTTHVAFDAFEVGLDIPRKDWHEKLEKEKACMEKALVWLQLLNASRQGTLEQRSDLLTGSGDFTAFKAYTDDAEFGPVLDKVKEAHGLVIQPLQCKALSTEIKTPMDQIIASFVASRAALTTPGADLPPVVSQEQVGGVLTQLSQSNMKNLLNKVDFAHRYIQAVVVVLTVTRRPYDTVPIEDADLKLFSDMTTCFRMLQLFMRGPDGGKGELKG